MRVAVIAAALVGGVGTWVAQQPMYIAYSAFAVVAFALAFVRPVDKLALGVVQQLRFPDRRRRFLIAVSISIVSALFIYLDNTLTGRGMFPRFHDDHSYILQTRMLALGKLWLPQHHAGQSFEAMHLLIDPVYTSIYFPGTAILNLPMAWLGLPYWLIPLLMTAAAVGLLYRVVTELVDGLAGVTASLVMLGVPVFRQFGTSVLSQPAQIFLGLVLIWLWLRWRRRRGIGWAIALGAVGGLALITRPVETLATVVPIGIAMLIRMRRDGIPRIAVTLAALALFASPFVALQAIHNHATTGKWTKFASDLFVERYYPGPMVGFSHPRPVDPPPQAPGIRDMARTYVLEAYRNHEWSRLGEDWRTRRFPLFVNGAIFCAALLPLAVIGVLGARRRQRWVMPTPVALTMGFYFFYVFFLDHYGAVFLPAMALAVALSPSVLGSAWPTLRRRAEAGVLLASVAAFATGVHAIAVRDSYGVFKLLEQINGVIAQIDKPALVLFPPGTSPMPHVEPVYNITTAWPDDATVVRANDLGPERNQTLFDYYARVQPERIVFMWDPQRQVVRPLGDVVSVAKANRDAADRTAP